jgi:hypothetical protein
LLPTETNTSLAKLLPQTSGAAKQAVQDVLTGKPLKPAERAALANLLNDLAAKDPAAAAALAGALQADLDRKIQLGALLAGNLGGASGTDSGGGSVDGGQGYGAIDGGDPAPSGGGAGYAPSVDGGSSPVTTDGSSAGSTPVTTGSTPADDGAAGAAAVLQSERLLKIRNDSGVKLTVFVQYRTQTDQGTWSWFPADPSQSDQALSFEIEAGAETYLDDAGFTIRGSRVRLWATSEAGGQWPDARNSDLWLVPEVDGTGTHTYPAPQMETFTYTFNP